MDRPIAVTVGGHRLTHQNASASAVPTGAIAADCRHYHGDRPCEQNHLCTGCLSYAPYSHRICIIKLGALGDVIRTLCILPQLRQMYPEAHITWVSLPNGCRMIQPHPAIDRVLPFDAVTTMVLAQETFDTVICLDKEPGPCALGMSLRAQRKLGIGLSEFGTPVPINPDAQSYFHLGLSDDLKFHRNTKSYPQLIYEALGWVYRGQTYDLPVDSPTRRRLAQRLSKRGWRSNRPTLGLNVGAGSAFANKMWPVPRLVSLLDRLRRDQPAMQVLLLGGPGERSRIDRIMLAMRNRGRSREVIDPGTHFDEPAFVALVDLCDVLYTGDTMAMHVGIARGKGVVAFFGPTCEQEIDLFGRGTKLIAQMACSPCYKRVCDRDDVCVQQISIDEAVAAVGQVLADVKRFGGRAEGGTERGSKFHQSLAAG